jgi:hypothetical protein
MPSWKLDWSLPTLISCMLERLSRCVLTNIALLRVHRFVLTNIALLRVHRFVLTNIALLRVLVASQYSFTSGPEDFVDTKSLMMLLVHTDGEDSITRQLLAGIITASFRSEAADRLVNFQQVMEKIILETHPYWVVEACLVKENCEWALFTVMNYISPSSPRPYTWDVFIAAITASSHASQIENYHTVSLLGIRAAVAHIPTPTTRAQLHALDLHVASEVFSTEPSSSYKRLMYTDTRLLLMALRRKLNMVV